MLPLLLACLLAVLAAQVAFLVFCVDASDAMLAVRAQSLCWIEADDGLYWDVRRLMRGGETDEQEGRTERRDFLGRGGSFGREAHVRRTLCAGRARIRFGYRVRDRALLPTWGLRSARFAREELLPELSRLLDGSEDPDDQDKQVYVVDDSAKEHDYLKVYHLRKDCQYVRGKDARAMTRDDAMARGFRPCVICLKKEIAKAGDGLL